MKIRFLKFIVMLIVTILPNIGQAQIPRTLSYQGVLSDETGSPKPDGSFALTFRLYDIDTGVDAICAETKTLEVTRGLFHTVLGDEEPFGASVECGKSRLQFRDVRFNRGSHSRNGFHRTGENFHARLHGTQAGKIGSAGLAVLITDGDRAGSANAAHATGFNRVSHPRRPQGMNDRLANFRLHGFSGHGYFDSLWFQFPFLPK